MPAEVSINDSDLSGLQSNVVEEEEDGGIRVCDIYIPPPPLAACTFDTTEPRLMISHIENINFKSYAAHQTLGPFDKNFTAIVGPNGSGKSNVIDAMLFVFGYRAQKIRSKKVGVLIHSSDNYRDLQSCTVRVHFQMIKDVGPNSYEVMPDSHFYISRTAYKDNSSVYEIDGKRSTFKEVGKTLRKFGIDLDHNRFLILQGEIEMIAMMKPKGNENDCGMLEYLEDIIGCNRFIEPIGKLHCKVEELNELRNDKLNRLKIILEEKEQVEHARNEAIEYVKFQNKIIMLESTACQLKLRDAEFELEKVVTSRDAVKQELAQLVEEQEALKMERAVIEKAYNEVRQEFAKCAAAAEECKERYSELERKDVVCRDNISNIKNKMKKLIKTLEQEEEKLKELKKQISVHEGEESELVKKKGIVEKKKESEEIKLNEVMASMKSETTGLQEEKEKHEAELIGLKKIANEIKAEVDIAQSELDIYVSNEKNEIDRLKELETEYANVTQSIDEKKRLHSEAENKIPQLEKKLKGTKQLAAEIAEKEQKLSAEIKIERQKVDDAKSAMNASRSQNTIVKCLLEQKQCGTIPGIFGRLGDLGAIDEKYDIAISTACGRLDNIVTDTIATAQKCVEYLKRTNKGYATFIALDKMEKWIPNTRQKFTAPENVPRLYDLVKVHDKRLLPAFYFALRDTLVANDLEQATRIGLHGQTRYRCVTLKGEIIELAGTMSGGGNRPLRGRMGKSIASTDINPAQIEKMTKNLDSMIQTLSGYRQEKVSCEERIAQMQKELVALNHGLKKNALEFEALKESQKTLSRHIQQQKPKVAAAAPDQGRVKQLNSQLKEKKNKFEQADDRASKVEEKVKKLHNEILQITKGKFGAVQKTVNKLTKEIDTIEGNITKCKVAVKNGSRNIKKTEDKITSLQEEIEQTKESREAVKQELQQLEEKAVSVLQRKEEAEKEMAEWDEKKRDGQQVVAEAKENELRLKSKHIELKNQLKSREEGVSEKILVVKEVKQKMGKLTLHEIDGEDEIPQLRTLSYSELEELSYNAVMYEIGAVQTDMAKIQPNMAAIKEFRKKEEQYQKKLAELDTVTEKRDEMKKCHEDLRKQRLDEFMAGFSIITSKLKEVYQMITLGGDAELELVDSLDPFTEGIIFSVRPPKKSWKNITNLSGGEKTLSSLALVFALHYYKPTPFYVMDEIDAALDFKNVSIVGNYIKERTKNAQFIIISLRNNMFELADRLVGIYKTFNATKSATINPGDLSGEDDGAGPSNREVYDSEVPMDSSE